MSKYAGLSRSQLLKAFRAVEDVFDWDAPDDDLSLYTAYHEEKEAIAEALGMSVWDAEKEAEKAQQPRTDQGRYAPAPRPTALPRDRQQLDKVDLANMSDKEIAKATGCGQLTAYTADPNHVNVDRMIDEENAKDAANAKAEWGAREIARREAAAKREWNDELAAHNAARAEKGLAPIRVPEQINEAELNELTGTDVTKAAVLQAKGHLIELTGMPAADFVKAYEAHEGTELAGAMRRAKSLQGEYSVDAQLEGAKILAGMNEEQTRIALEHGGADGAPPAASEFPGLGVGGV